MGGRTSSGARSAAEGVARRQTARRHDIFSIAISNLSGDLALSPPSILGALPLYCVFHPITSFSTFGTASALNSQFAVTACAARKWKSETLSAALSSPSGA